MWLNSVVTVTLLVTTTRLMVMALHSNPVHRQPRCVFGWRWMEVAGGDTLTLTSPNYPASYDYFSHCGWTIWPTSRNVILKLRCDTFYLQESKNGICHDFLRIQQVKYCGSNTPVFSTKNITKLGITFHSNGRLNYPGFQCSLTASNPNTQHCVCGKQASSGAKVAPWLAVLVLVNSSQAFCSASIVREHWVLTSATCAARIKHNKYNYAVRVGIGQDTGSVLIPIRRVLLHPASLHGLSHTDANLALIHLKQAITFRNGAALPVCLPLSPAHHRPASGSPKWQGWRGAEVEEQECLPDHQGPAWLCGQPADLCHPEKGDLGSPLVAKSKGGGWVQVGVAVGGNSCAGDKRLHQESVPHAQVAYISVINHLSWIVRTLGRDNTCPQRE
ncbi:ovochymase-2-like [Scylla paramamosain]|uniref:ovochymase-2-like n=1 Tax=Scylla paramamosain TaxID=85552 RepID=UPI00308279A0